MKLEYDKQTKILYATVQRQEYADIQKFHIPPGSEAGATLMKEIEKERNTRLKECGACTVKIIPMPQ